MGPHSAFFYLLAAQQFNLVAKSKDGSETPLMRQYNQLKGKYPDAMLLFRVGDFYELFGEDAVTAAAILNITLTRRANGSASEVALAGFPHHSLDTYLPRLVKAGKKVAVCDQLEDPALAKGLVKRGVTELVTPGTAQSDNVLEGHKNNYLAAVHKAKDGLWGLAMVDYSTGYFACGSMPLTQLNRVLEAYGPTEVLSCKDLRQQMDSHLSAPYLYSFVDNWVFELDNGTDQLLRHFKTASLKGFGVEQDAAGVVAAGVILYYLAETEHHQLSHINSLQRLDGQEYMWMDRFTIRNLELVQPSQPGGKCLLDVYRPYCQTNMGARQLYHWLLHPLVNVDDIMRRQQVVTALVKHGALRETLQEHLRQVSDLERLASKIATGRAHPRLMVQLYQSLELCAHLRSELENSGQQALQNMALGLEPLPDLAAYLKQHILPDTPMQCGLGKTIAPGINTELDHVRTLATKGKDYLLELQQRECERTGISSLKVSYNKVFGYYLEVTNALKDKVPAEWIRKQTLVNAERYITPELKEYEEKIVNAEGEMSTLENALFAGVVTEAAQHIQTMQITARAIAALDCLACFATAAQHFNYCAPSLNDGTALDIKDGRHPVIERFLPPGEPYVENDVCVDEAQEQILVITGPNMAGKSALLRQTALITLLAQTGSWVPARTATVGLVDKLFTRVGASDNLSRGESTFMVEMTETATILNNMTGRSLVLMDEIGRGTSTYDGVSIAWAVVEHLHNHARHRPRTLFATHYHELNILTKTLARVKNYNVAVKETGDTIIFLRKLKPGGSQHSFGIQVARLAGMPVELVLRSNAILKQLEQEKGLDRRKDKLKDAPAPSAGLFTPAVNPGMAAVQEALAGLDINSMAPMQALLKLQELQLMIK